MRAETVIPHMPAIAKGCRGTGTRAGAARASGRKTEARAPTIQLRESAPLSKVGGDALVEALGENYALRDVRVDEGGLAGRVAPLLRRNAEFGDVRWAGRRPHRSAHCHSAAVAAEDRLLPPARPNALTSASCATQIMLARSDPTFNVLLWQSPRGSTK